MAGPQVLLYAVGLPIVGAAIAWTAAFLSWRSVRDQVATADVSPRGSTPTSRLLVLLALPATLVLFGFSLYVLLASASANVMEGILELSARAYGIAALLAGVGFAIVFWRGVAESVLHQKTFFKVVLMMEMPEVVVLFGYALGFLLLQFGLTLAPQVAVVPDAAALATLYINLGSFGAPASAILEVNAYDFETLESWKTGLRTGSVGLVVAIIFLVLSYLTLSAGG